MRQTEITESTERVFNNELHELHEWEAMIKGRCFVTTKHRSVDEVAVIKKARFLMPAPLSMQRASHSRH